MTNGDFIRSMTDEDITENFTRGMHKVTRLKYMTLTQSLIPTTVVLRGLQVAAFAKT